MTNETNKINFNNKLEIALDNECVVWNYPEGNPMLMVEQEIVLQNVDTVINGEMESDLEKQIPSNKDWINKEIDERDLEIALGNEFIFQADPIPIIEQDITILQNVSLLDECGSNRQWNNGCTWYCFLQ